MLLLRSSGGNTLCGNTEEKSSNFPSQNSKSPYSHGAFAYPNFKEKQEEQSSTMFSLGRHNVSFDPAGRK